jgi:hypothetical protein
MGDVAAGRNDEMLADLWYEQEIAPADAPEPDILAVSEWIYRGWMRDHGRPCSDHEYNIAWLEAYRKSRGEIGELPF